MNDSRFTIEKTFRRPGRYDTRNPTGQVPNGWVLRDGLLGASRRFDTKREATERRDRQLALEAELPSMNPSAWRSELTSTTQWAEIRMLDADGRDLGQSFGLVGVHHNETVSDRLARVRAWLELVGLGDLARARDE